MNTFIAISVKNTCYFSVPSFFCLQQSFLTPMSKILETKFYIDTKNERNTEDLEFKSITKEEYESMSYLYHQSNLKRTETGYTEYRHCKYRDLGCKSKVKTKSFIGENETDCLYYLKTRHFHDFDLYRSIVKKERISNKENEVWNKCIIEVFDEKKQGFDLIKEKIETALGKKITDTRKLSNKIHYIKNTVYLPNRLLTLDMLKEACRVASSNTISTHASGDTNDYRIYVGFKMSYIHMFENRPFHLDTTFKLLTTNFVVIIAGVTDASGSFCTVGALFCKAENIANIDYLVTTISDEAREMHADKTIDISCCVTDAGNANIHVLNNRFSTTPKKWCYFHLNKQLNQHIKIKDGLDKSKKSTIISVLNAITMLPSLDLFNLASEKFLGEFEQDLKPPSVEYVKLSVLGQENVAEATDLFAPSTNNAVESLNGKIKRHITKGRKMETLEFMNYFIDWISSTGNKHYFALKPIYGASDRKLDPWILVGTIKKRAHTHTIFSIKEQSRTPQEIISKFLSNDFWAIYDMVAFFKQYAIVTTSKKAATYKDIVCTCYAFVKTNVCPHIWNVVESIKELSDLVDTVLDGKIGSKVGRKKKNQVWSTFK